jgi:hypothetical protein
MSNLPRFSLRTLFVVAAAVAFLTAVWVAMPEAVANGIMLFASFAIASVAAVTAGCARGYARAFAVGALLPLLALVLHLSSFIGSLQRPFPRPTPPITALPPPPSYAPAAVTTLQVPTFDPYSRVPPTTYVTPVPSGSTPIYLPVAVAPTLHPFLGWGELYRRCVVMIVIGFVCGLLGVGACWFLQPASEASSPTVGRRGERDEAGPQASADEDSR